MGGKSLCMMQCWVRASKTLILLLWIFGGWGRAILRAVVAGGPGQGAQVGFQLLVLGSLLIKDGWGWVGDLHSILNAKHHPVDMGNLRKH